MGFRVMTKLCLTSMIVVALTAIADAGTPSVPQLVNFQARVAGPGGLPVADGNYPVSFSLFTHSSGGGGGVFLWSESAPSIGTAGGTFTHALGSITPFGFNFEDYDSLWLEIVFDGEVQTPRVHLQSTPSSQVANALEMRSQFSPTVNAIETRQIIGGLSQNGSDGAEQIRLWGPSWGEILLNDATINSISDEVSLSSVSGGELRLRKPDGLSGATLISGSVGAGALLALTNDAGSTTVLLDGDQSGDDAVEIPAGAISAIEELNEPGIASANISATTSLSQFVNTVVESQTLTSPSSGYVLAIGTCQIEIGHTNGTTDSAMFGVSTNGSFTTTGSMLHMIPGSASTGNHYDIITVQAVFSVLAGPTTVDFLAMEALGSYVVRKRQLSLVFIPTAYGTYEPPSAPPGDDGHFDAFSSPESETENALTFETVRLKEELALVRARAEETTRRLAELEASIAESQSSTRIAEPEK